VVGWNKEKMVMTDDILKKELEITKSDNKYKIIVAIAKEARKLNERKRNIGSEKVTTTALRMVMNNEVEIRMPADK
jgi:DNA-directed RNA polymerase subunit K/omega